MMDAYLVMLYHKIVLTKPPVIEINANLIYLYVALTNTPCMLVLCTITYTACIDNRYVQLFISWVTFFDQAVHDGRKVSIF